MLKGLWFGLFCAGWLIAATSSELAAKPASSLPRALHGIWFVQDETATTRTCSSYLALPPQAGKEQRLDQLVGSLVIAPKLIHSVAEYGEGNFYTVQRVTKSGNNQWAVSAGLTFDTRVADAAETKKIAMTLTLNGKRLNTSESGDKHGPFATSGLVKCTAKLPKGY